MSINRNYFFGFNTFFAVFVMAAMLAACGGGGAAGSITTPALNQTGTGSSTLTTIPTTTGNSTSLIVDSGPVPSIVPSVNVAYVTVTVCTPGTSGSTAACQTIDHVAVDTGSSGLRLLNSVLSSKLVLPAATNNGLAIGECSSFAIGTTWGSVRLADIYIGGEVAKSIPIQDIGDNPGGASNIPTDCKNTGVIQDTQTTLGSNGILGIGLATNDCNPCSSQVIPAFYYTCTTSGCVGSTVPPTTIVSNPVVSFQNPITGVAQDNNGTLIELPTVALSAGPTVYGSLIFGIGTQANNVLNTSTTTVYPTDAYGNFTTTFNNQSLTQSYLDSGSNGLFFYNSTNISFDAYGWYIPASTLSLSAINSSPSGMPSGTINFTLVDADTLAANIVAANIGGKGSSNIFAWGLPFYYGRKVFTGIAGASTITQSGAVVTVPYWAY